MKDGNNSEFRGKGPGHIPRSFSVALSGWLVLALLLSTFWNSERTNAESLSCGINQITFTNGGVFGNDLPSFSADGTRIAFRSDRNLTGGNADGNLEIFLYDVPTNSFTQISHTLGGEIGNISPSINADGTRIAFASDGPTGDNGDGNVEIYLYYVPLNTLSQVTNTTGGSFGNGSPSINYDGTRIALTSDRDLAGNGSTGSEIYLYNVPTNSFTQITNTVGLSAQPAISGDGTRVAFTSEGDVVGTNTGHNLEVFLYNTTTNSFTQITETLSASSGGASLNANGTRIAFTSTGFFAANPEGNSEVFLYDTATGGFSQITFTSGGSNSSPSINADGTRIAFVSASDLAGENADGNREIFLYDVPTHTFTQVTHTLGGDFFANESPSINADGTKIAFNSSLFADIGNADGNSEIILATCLPPPSADLLISQSADRTVVRQGDTLTYTITVTNFGPNGAANVVVNDTLSSGVSFVSAQAGRGVFTGPPPGQTGTVTWNLGAMDAEEQESAQLTVTVKVRGKTTIRNTVTVGSSIDDPNMENNTSSLTTSVAAGGGRR